MKRIILMSCLLMPAPAFAANWYTTAASPDGTEGALLDTDSIKIVNLFSLKPIDKDFNENIYVTYSQKIQTPTFIQIKDMLVSCKYWIYSPTYVQVFDRQGKFVADKTPQLATVPVPTDSLDGITANHVCYLAAARDYKNIEDNPDKNMSLLKYRFPNHYKAVIGD